MATIIEAPETFRESLMPIPADHMKACAAYPDAAYGNAAGKHGLDLTGANTEVPVGSSGAMYPPKEASHGPAASQPE
jgi:iron transport multicopper oxidase